MEDLKSSTAGRMKERQYREFRLKFYRLFRPPYIDANAGPPVILLPGLAGVINQVGGNYSTVGGTRFSHPPGPSSTHPSGGRCRPTQPNL